MTPWLLAGAGTVVACLGVLTAVAASSIGRVELYRWIAGSTPGANAAEHLLGAPDRIVRAAKGVTTLGSLVAGLALAGLLGALPVSLLLAALGLVAVPALISLIYAVPRVAGRRNAPRIVQRAIPVMMQVTSVLSPLSKERQGGVPEQQPQTDDQEDLPALSGLLAFSQRPVREVMTPRTEITAAREGVTVEELGRVFMESGFSRIPIYRESLDDTIGMIYAFDLLKLAPGAELPLRQIATIPGSKQAGETLFEMQRDRTQIAMVLDEFGGTAGMVTFEDLLEELVGEIFDEHDGLLPPTRGDRRVVEVKGTTEIEEVEALFDVRFPEGSAVTVAGLLTGLAGRIPAAGDRYVLAGLEFDVLQATPTHLERVVIRPGPVAAVHLQRGRDV
jgi:CBS domain containing-hemolysin-like protein